MPVDASLGTTVDLLQGLAGILAADGTVTDQTDPTKAYQATDTALTFGDMPAAPDRCVTLATYQPGGDSLVEGYNVLNVQARVRGNAGDYLDMEALAGHVFDAFQGLTGRQLGSAWLIQLAHKSSVPLGMDAAKRWEKSLNFTAEINVPPTALRPL